MSTIPQQLTDHEQSIIKATYAYVMTQGKDIATLQADHRQWLTTMMPDDFRSVDDFTSHHKEFWQHVWALKRSTVPDTLFFIVNRGGMKSTNAEALGPVCGALDKRSYALYVCEVQNQANKHVSAIGAKLATSNIGKYYPMLAQPEVREVGDRKVQLSWNRMQLRTAGGFAVDAFGLDSAMRGVKLDSKRPDLIIFDDIDNEKDSPLVIEGKIERITGAILPAGSDDCAIFFVQNLIHRDSILNRLLTHREGAQFLLDRKVIGPIPAVQNASYERRDNRWFITAGTATWPGMDLGKCEANLNKWGKRKWEMEAQHNIELPYEGAVYPVWNEIYHVITQSEFARFFEPRDVVCHTESGKWKLPDKGSCAMAQDWGNNPKHPCVTRWIWKPSEGMQLTDSVFWYREMCWPKYPLVENDERAAPSARRVGVEIVKRERFWGEADRMEFRLASHERPEVIVAYQMDMPDGYELSQFEQIDTAQAKEGINLMQNFLEIDFNEPHPFRVYPDGHEKAGEPLMGRPRAYCVVADGQGELYWDEVLGQLKVRSAINEDGQARIRFERPLYRVLDNAQGVEATKPFKRDDDAEDVDRALAGRWFPDIQPLTANERAALRLHRLMPLSSRPLDSIAAETWDASRQLHYNEMREEEEKQERSWIENLDGWNEQ